MNKMITQTERLDSYVKQIKKTKLSPRINVTKTLSILAPLAASALISSELNAQCGGGVFNPAGGGYDGTLAIGSNTLGFDTFCGTSSGVVTSFYVFMTNYGIDFGQYGVAGGDPITSLGTLPVYGGFAQIFSPTGAGNLAGLGSFYIPITDGTSFGFVEITPPTSCGDPFINPANSGLQSTSTSGPISAGDCQTLPVELTSFSIRSAKGVHNLSWATATEINNDGFEIQRSMDGVNFQRAGWVNGEGNSNREVSYEFADTDVKANVQYYYRLKQMDFDGRSEYSDVISAQYNDRNALTIGDFTPNPAQFEVALQISSGVENQANVILFDQLGGEILNQQYTLSVGDNTLNIDINNIPSATYYAKVIIGNEVNYKKLVVIND